jgi:uncharacterized protein (TIGR00290 family)
MVTEDRKYSRSHGLSTGVLQLQAKAIGIPLVQRPATKDNYEAEFKRMLQTFKEEGIDGGVFGDIDFIGHRQWIDRVCHEVNIAPYLPLWGESQDKIMREFIDLGFEAIVVTSEDEMLGEEWLGQRIDLNFLKQLETKDISPCGEAGEYHTLVIDGPLFKKRLEILGSDKVLRQGRWFMDILQVGLKDK